MGPETRVEKVALFSKSGIADELEDELGDEWSLFDLERLSHLFS